MRAALKNSIFSQLSTQGTELLSVRSGTPIVQANSAKLSLGSTANSYSSSVVESSALTAVISSIGQIPRDVVHFKSQSEFLDLTVLKDSTEEKSLEAQQVFAQAVSQEIPVQIIISLADPQNDASLRVIPSQDVHWESVAPINNLAAIELLTSPSISSNRPLLTNVETIAPSLPGEFSTLASRSMATQATLNDSFSTMTFSALNVSLLIDSVSIVPIASLATSPVDAASQSSSAFRGITVSGLPDAKEFLMIVAGPLQGMVDGQSDQGVVGSKVLLIASDSIASIDDQAVNNTPIPEPVILVNLSAWQGAEIFAI